MDRVGVIVGRFQVPELHAGHELLIDEVIQLHDNIMLFIGVSGGQPTNINPLSFSDRKNIIQNKYSELLFDILPIYDMPSDDKWSSELDKMIDIFYPKCEAVLYGSRDSFINHYSGKHSTQEIIPIACPSGTEIRNNIPPSYNNFNGIIYTQNKRFPISYQVIDVAIIKRDTDEVLLGRKKTDEPGYRFIGGFVDPLDESLEISAKREVWEEVSCIEIDNIKYIGSCRINDHRYRGSSDGIMSAMFVSDFIFGSPKPSDDIDEIKWVKISSLEENLIGTHKQLGSMFLKKYNKGEI